MPSPVLFVGEANPYGLAPEFALYCMPPESAGGRLQRLVCGLRRHTYLALARVNLCQGNWNLKEARNMAGEILSRADTPPVVVMLGRKVFSAFEKAGEWDWAGRPFDVRGGGRDGRDFITLPHPSGLCRLWAEPGAFERARALLRQDCPSVPWGELDAR